MYFHMFSSHEKKKILNFKDLYFEGLLGLFSGSHIINAINTWYM
ncbi:hypothetical protein NC651_040398 [Populus alba x Populus x berolinensis]|nr:hypothetical protein NC651_040398 [Populus alba x Populus x berolinensis]